MSRQGEQTNETLGKVVFGAILFAAWLFFGASIFSYSPWNAPTQFVYHNLEEVRNFAGLPGAWCAYLVFLCFGVVAYMLVITLGIVILVYMVCDHIREPKIKALGVFLALVSLCGGSAYIFDNIVDPAIGPPIGPGGCIGALIKFLFDQVFVTSGAYLALVGILLSGFVLILPENVLYLLFWRTGINRATYWLTKPFRQRMNSVNPHLESGRLPSSGATQRYVAPTRALPPNVSGREQRTLANGASQGLNARSYFTGEWDARAPYPDDPAKVTPTPSASRIAISNPSQSTTSRVQGGASSYVPEIPQDDTSQDVALVDRVNAPLAPSLSHLPTAPTAGDANAWAQTSDQSDVYPTVEEEDYYEYPSIDLLEEQEAFDYSAYEREIIERGAELERVCRSFNVEIKVVDVQTGPVLTLYEIELKEGLRVKALHNLTNDLEIAMKAPHVRIVSPIPGKKTVGVEIPNANRQLVRLREVMEHCAEQASSMAIPIFLGKDVVGAPMVADLAQLPHLLIAGRTGTGKSVCLNSIIMSILMTRSPNEVRLILIDPKMVELSPYKTIPHLMHPVVTDMQKAEAILEWAVNKMEDRYRIFAKVGARKLSEFNQMSPETMRRRLRPRNVEEWAAFPKSMPSIVIVADEMADLIMTSGKDVERHIVRLAQKSRAVGIHLVLATQKPTVDVVTGLIKSNLPARIAFGVASRIDSQVVLDVKGAEQLLGHGDMLFLLPGTSQLIRGQGAFVSDREIDAVIEAISIDEPNYEVVIDEPSFDPDDADAGDDASSDYDEYFAPAVEFVIGEGRASTSKLQRRFSIGYTRAARIIDMMTEAGLVSAFNPQKPSRPRDVLVTMDEWRRRNAENSALDAPSLPIIHETPEHIDDTYVATRTHDYQEYDLSPHQNASTPQRTPDPRELGETPNSNAPISANQGGWTDEQWEQYLNVNEELESQ
ncbi:MAG: DNA translocase FtsK [Planctomycetia bacterium]|nr:DNA translocase FtsK [Planctomycetia bacterium]